MHLRRGKAILPWTPTPDEAIAATCHVNHKYALDGCDPCSYGGILWCFGLFDKPMGVLLSTLLHMLLCRFPAAKSSCPAAKGTVHGALGEHTTKSLSASGRICQGWSAQSLQPDRLCKSTTESH